MKITFIQHSSFFLELDEYVLLFDYFDGELPPLPKKDLIVFSSHHHGDHYHKRIFNLPAKEFILSDDIPIDQVPNSEKIHWIAPHQTITVGNLVISTLKSTDEGVAFVISVDGKTIYFAGDLNNWFWEEEGAGYTSPMTQAYREELKRLPPHLELAFVPVDPRLGKWAFLGATDLLAQVTVDYLVPMHLWGEFALVSSLRDEVQENTVTILAPNATGEVWRIS